MGAEFICDVCGKREVGWANRLGRWFKPSQWYQRTIGEEVMNKKTQVVCSRKCLEELGGLVLPW